MIWSWHQFWKLIGFHETSWKGMESKNNSRKVCENLWRFQVNIMKHLRRKGWDFNKDLYTETKSAQLRIQRKTGLIKLANIQEHILNKLSKWNAATTWEPILYMSPRPENNCTKKTSKSGPVFLLVIYLEVSRNGGTPKWMVYCAKSHENGKFWGTSISGNRIYLLGCWIVGKMRWCGTPE